MSRIIVTCLAMLFLLDYSPAPNVDPDPLIPFDPNVSAVAKYRILEDTLLDSEEIVVYELNGQDVTLTSDILTIGEPFVHVDVNGVKTSEFPWSFQSSDPNIYYGHIIAIDSTGHSVESNIVIKVDEDKPPIIGGCRTR